MISVEGMSSLYAGIYPLGVGEGSTFGSKAGFRVSLRFCSFIEHVRFNRAALCDNRTYMISLITGSCRS
jgi:hypothetical protein